MLRVASSGTPAQARTARPALRPCFPTIYASVTGRHDKRRARRPAGAVASALANNSHLTEYICDGPLLKSCGIAPQQVVSRLDSWVELGELLSKQLRFDHAQLNDSQRARIYHYYLPVYFWVHDQLQQHKASGSPHAMVVGISAPQGCGKTTLVEQLQQLFSATGSAAASVSVDDFYLTFKDQTALAARHPDNPLLQYRGNAGSHDLELGSSSLRALRGLRQPGQTAAVPRYDKSAHGGRGDRAPPSSWPQVQGPLEVVLFEGWMSGFKPLEQDQAAAQVHPGLPAVNAALRPYEAAWDSLVDCWLVVRIEDPAWVTRWRQQAEVAMRAQGRPGLSEEQVADFVSRFMPAYKAYLPGLYKQGPTTARPGHTLVIEVDQNRSPVQNQPAAVL